jgi:hypothetical protein
LPSFAMIQVGWLVDGQIHVAKAAQKPVVSHATSDSTSNIRLDDVEVQDKAGTVQALILE